MDQKTERKIRKQDAPSKTPEQRQQERRDRFVRLAPKRVNNALRALKTVGSCGNRAGYSYTEDEARKIIGVLQDAVTEVQDAYSQKSGGRTLFSL